MRTTFLAAALGAGLLLAAVPVVAHHSFAAEFDADKPFKLTGVVTKVEWQNPHTYFYLDVTDERTKKVTNWAFEMGSPNGLMRNGWTRNTLKIGDAVTVEGSLARDGKPYGNARTVVLDSTASGCSRPPARRPTRDAVGARRRRGAHRDWRRILFGAGAGPFSAARRRHAASRGRHAEPRPRARRKGRVGRSLHPEHGDAHTRRGREDRGGTREPGRGARRREGGAGRAVPAVGARDLRLQLEEQLEVRPRGLLPAARRPAHDGDAVSDGDPSTAGAEARPDDLRGRDAHLARDLHGRTRASAGRRAEPDIPRS